MKIFVINLDSSVERRENMVNQLNKIHIDWEFFSAFDGRSLTAEKRSLYYDKDKALLNVGREMSNGEIGCAMSHRMIYKKIIDEHIPEAIILEDDIVLHNDFEKTIESICAISNKFNKMVIKFEVSDQDIPYTIWHRTKLDNSRKVVKPATKKVFLTAGYYIDNKAAMKLYKISNKIITVADHWSYFGKYIKLRFITSGIVKQDQLYQSEIWKHENVSTYLKTKKRYPRGLNYLVKKIRKIDLIFIRQLLP